MQTTIPHSAAAQNPNGLPMEALIKWTSTILIVFSPVLLYVKQYLIIKKAQSVGSFSHFLCLVMIFGSIARTLFYIGEPFEFSLLLQAFSLFVIQLLLLNVCVKCKDNSKPFKKEKIMRKIFSCSKIWTWKSYHKYIQFVFTIAGFYIFIFV